MRNFVQPGKVLSLTAPAGGVVAGSGVQIGQLFVVAANDAAEGQPFEGHTEGVFDLPKTSAQAWSVGDLVYWSGTECTTTASGNLLIGCAVEPAANPSSTGRVRLNGTATPDAA